MIIAFLIFRYAFETIIPKIGCVEGCTKFGSDHI